MGLENFVPEIWSAKLFVRLRKSLVFGNVVNRDYEGEISGYGDTVHINEIGPIAVSAYTKNTDITFATLDDASKTLLIDQAKYFAFSIDDIDRAQTNPKLMNAAMDEAAYAVGDTVDQFIAGLYAGAGITGSSTYIGASGSSLSVSSGNVIETLSYIARYMDEANVPRGDRWGIIPPWLHQKLLLAETGGISSTAVPKVMDDGALVSGFVGSTYGFNLFMSNNVSTDNTQYRCMFGTRSAISYAGQIAQIKAVDLEKQFGQGVKGLYVYGAKVVRPEALCTAYLAAAAG